MKKLVAVLLTFFLFLTGCSVEKIENDIETDSIKFSKEYPVVSEDNLYEYTTFQNVYDFISNGTGIVYLGYPECDDCDAIVRFLNDAAKESNVTKIYYYNIKDIKDNNTDEFKALTQLLKAEKEILAPTVIFVKDGTIKNVFYNEVDDNQQDYLKDTFKSFINELK